MSDLIKFRFEISKEDLALEKEKMDLKIEKVNSLEVPTSNGLQEARFVETVVVIATVTLAIMAKRIVDDWLKKREEGVQIRSWGTLLNSITYFV